MSELHQDSILFSKDLLTDENENTGGPGAAISQTEIEDLLYNDMLGARERVGRLRQFRDELSMLEAGDFGDNDPGALVGEIDQAIARLEGMSADGAVETALDIDPAEHRETLAPDDDLLDDLDVEDDDDADLFAIDGEDGDEVLDPKEWDEGDGFNSGKGVH